MPVLSRPRSTRRVRLVSVLAVVASAVGVLSIAAPAPEAHASAPASSLSAGATLRPGTVLTSPSGLLRLSMQTDGNLVLYSGCGDPSEPCTSPMWALGTFGQPGNFLTMQSDGNLVLYSRAGRPVWATQTKGTGSTNVFRVQDDMNMVVYSGGRPVWNSGVYGSYAHVAGLRVPDLWSQSREYWFGAPGNSIVVWDQIGPDHPILWTVDCLDDPRVDCPSTEGKLVLQADGNLVWYQPGIHGGWVAEWNSGTAGAGPTTSLVMQNDGNAVLYDLWHRPLWSSKTGLIRR